MLDSSVRRWWWFGTCSVSVTLFGVPERSWPFTSFGCLDRGRVLLVGRVWARALTGEKGTEPVSTSAIRLVSMIGVADRNAFKQASFVHVLPSGEERLVPFVGERAVKHVSKHFPKHNDAVCTGLKRCCSDIY